MSEREHYLFNQRLNASEKLLRKELGDERVNAIIEKFKAMAEINPLLQAELAAEPHPYEWVRRQVERWQAELH